MPSSCVAHRLKVSAQPFVDEYADVALKLMLAVLKPYTQHEILTRFKQAWAAYWFEFRGGKSAL